MAGHKKHKPIRKIIIICFSIILAVALICGAYIAYVFLSFHRIPDNQRIEIVEAENQSGQTKVAIGKEYKAISYNIGFSAYLPDFSFFMDGGTESWAKSKESVEETTDKIASLLKKENADFYSLQEVDSDSTRTYHVDETQIIKDKLDQYYSAMACCFDSPFLFWPITQPHGKSVSNIMTLSKIKPRITAKRMSFPIDEGLTKILDYDRCYTTVRFQTENGKELVWYTTHMSAYAKDPTTSNKQIEMLIKSMQEEYKKGNYVVCGADFNKSLLENPEQYYPDDKIYEVKAFPEQMLVLTDIKTVLPFNPDKPAGSCRDASEPLSSSTKVCNIDGFLISDNIELIKSDVVDNNFEYSDHNPVYMTFKLK